MDLMDALVLLDTSLSTMVILVLLIHLSNLFFLSLIDTIFDKLTSKDTILSYGSKTSQMLSLLTLIGKTNASFGPMSLLLDPLSRKFVKLILIGI